MLDISQIKEAVMTDPLYVLNTSELELHNTVEKSSRGLGSLLPNEVGKIPAEIVNDSRIQQWIENKRLKVISEEEFYKYFDANEFSKENVSLKAKHRPESIEGSTVIVPGLDELPEVDELPDPVVHNIDNVISVRAPNNDAPLIERAGDPITVTKDKLKAIHIDDRGRSLDNPEITEELPKASILPENRIAEDAIAEDAITKTHDTTTVETILTESAWRRQVKAIDSCTDKAVVEAVEKQTKRDVLKRACRARLEQL